MKLDILAIAAHPDDVELGCAGTLLAHLSRGDKVGILDLTQGELGTRGTPQIRLAEAAAAATVLGIHVRENVGLPDGFFENTKPYQLQIVPYIRRYQPEIVLLNAPDDRHPDHGRGAALIGDACFLSGLRQIETLDEQGNKQEAWRPKFMYHFIQDRYLKPDFIVDITAHWPQKLEAIRAFQSQFFDPNSKEPTSYISTPDFLDFVRARAEEMGHAIGVKYGEGFITKRAIGVSSLSSLK